MVLWTRRNLGFIEVSPSLGAATWGDVPQLSPRNRVPVATLPLRSCSPVAPPFRHYEAEPVRKRHGSMCMEMAAGVSWGCGCVPPSAPGWMERAGRRRCVRPRMGLATQEGGQPRGSNGDGCQPAKPQASQLYARAPPPPPPPRGGGGGGGG